jgi:hypothetical protein
MLDLFGVAGRGMLGKSNAEWERPYLAAWSGKDRAYRAGRMKSRGAAREFWWGLSIYEDVQHNALEGREPALVESAGRQA